MNSEINSLKDLYQLLLPALKSKKREMKLSKNSYIKEIDIWNYIKDNIWQNSNNLTLSDMVSDILNTDNDLIGNYVARQITDSRISNEEE